ncbi:MAG: FAD-dependent oxidoreductase [Spirochaetia bacterium]|nr:FAD-dependent oxidoreductase [Spirochaetia bacterium]
MSDNKIKTYVCTGCGIGDHVDIDKLKIAPKDYGSDEAVTHPFLCGEEGVAILKKEVEGGVNQLVIGACSMRANEDRFTFEGCQTHRANLREGCAWITEPKTEHAQFLAEDNLNMSVVKAKKTTPNEPFVQQLERGILVVGGGITGISSALAAANAGTPVVIVEKSDKLGGQLGKFKKIFPRMIPFEQPQENDIEKKIAEVNGHSNIKVLLNTEIEKIAGQPGMFDVTVKGGGGDKGFRVGAIIQATGFVPYDASKLGHLGYGSSQNVITNMQFEEMYASGKLTRPSDGKEVKSVAFVQCAGSRDPEHLAYCSSFCCMTSLKQAAYVKEQNPDSSVFIFYQDMMTPGRNEYFYKKMQDETGIFLTKGKVSSVSALDDGAVGVTATETLLGEDVNVKADLVVLATGMETAAKNGGALNLDYRQGPELPGLNYGFPDSHFICFPYETRRTGIYAAGTVRQPMDGAMAETDAEGAALKAIQSIELSSQGKSVHPRVGDLSYPRIATDRCTQCKRCTEECPYGMYDEDEKGSPIINPLRCRRCGTCMGACPAKVISFPDFNLDMVSSMIRAISVPQDDEDQLRILVFACENDSIPAFDMAGLARLKLNPRIRVIPLRCLGSLSLVWLSDAFSAGIDGVLMFGCKYGDDYQCHNVRGSELASERMGKLSDTLGRMMIEPERVQIEQLAINDYQGMAKKIDEFVELVESYGPNPFKEFG